MRKNILLEEVEINEPYLIRDIHHSLNEIKAKLEHELTVKEKQLDICFNEIKALQKKLEDKEIEVKEASVKLIECQRNNEGNRQIINKLLNDLERKLQDIEWYKRTYETRSLLGTLKEKIFGKAEKS